ncbi:hypothetical protein TOT_020000077 [Theileria orientalis strain Shintoku]|uniref:Uncharacterized protein n=1 Tax=Theileria orientalis strain Shintoku TaxID=869250 RepID=J4C346_THEOR|nr:hypothetical protein TOT_020000077 [Theileria orientalis strain Shintoku]BAM39806.1 hypothetical protein TOT_020000077 [Theileria orientalis strain Shintoku]|eukprot:XP_009690107.1 hypothetical protein TOT_020000077 [Theileria orientalis strain Shintoku]
MLKLIRVLKNIVFVLTIGRILGTIRASNPLGSSSTANSSQQSPESQPPEQQDPYKTTFEGELVNLDINSLHGYSKFTCTIEYTEVTYQSGNKFKSALDGETEIWKATNTNAFRFKSQLLDLKPISLSVEFNRNDDSTALYFRKKYNSSEWEGIDKQAHNQFVELYKNKLKEYKESIEKDTKEAVDLDLLIKSTTEIEFDFHDYKSKHVKISEGTEAAKAAKQNITNTQYTLTNSEEKDDAGVVNKIMDVLLSDKKYRIVKVKVKTKVGINSDVWQTGGSAFCTKMVAKWQGDKLKEIVLSLTYKDSGKNSELLLNVTPNWKYLYNFEEITEKDLATFDFQY